MTIELRRCSKCKKSLEHKDPAFPAGVGIKLLIPRDDEEAALRLFGKYAPKGKDTEIEYAFCWECYLDSLFGV
jgi:hypothetical protein